MKYDLELTYAALERAKAEKYKPCKIERAEKRFRAACHEYELSVGAAIESIKEAREKRALEEKKRQEEEWRKKQEEARIAAMLAKS